MSDTTVKFTLIFGQTTRLQADQCPYCGTSLDAASAMTQAVRPKPGDLTVCIGCVQVLQFNDGMRLRKPSDDELQTMFIDDPVLGQELRQIQQAVRSIEKHRHG